MKIDFFTPELSKTGQITPEEVLTFLQKTCHYFILDGFSWMRAWRSSWILHQEE
jgi:hypothetical protein